MADLNSVALTGRLTADPEFKEFGEGKKVANFSLAVNEYKKDGDAVSFVPVTVWDKTAEVAKNFLTKGSQVAIKGRLQQQRWEQPDGQKRSKIQIVCESLTLLGGKKKESAEPAASVSGGDSPF
jgi:single-strand DNA-binding protein